MKKVIFFILSVLLVSCSLDSELEQPTPSPISNWSLIQSIGGIAGTSSEFQENQITWTFDEVNGTLEVVHNISGVSVALDPGTYDYMFQNIDDEDFIFIDGVEYGAITINPNRFLIDQSITSDGSNISDVYEYRFSR